MAKEVFDRSQRRRVEVNTDEVEHPPFPPASVLLKWNRFTERGRNAYSDLLLSGELADVTLACSGEYIKAHKVVLASSSEYFRQAFSENSCKHPIVLMKGIQFKELNSILHFIYFGEVLVQKHDINKFIEASDFLEIEGIDFGHDEQNHAQQPPNPNRGRRNNTPPEISPKTNMYGAHIPPYTKSKDVQQKLHDSFLVPDPVVDKHHYHNKRLGHFNGNQSLNDFMNHMSKHYKLSDAGLESLAASTAMAENQNNVFSPTILKPPFRSEPNTTSFHRYPVSDPQLAATARQVDLSTKYRSKKTRAYHPEWTPITSIPNPNYYGAKELANISMVQSHQPFPVSQVNNSQSATLTTTTGIHAHEFDRSKLNYKWPIISHSSQNNETTTSQSISNYKERSASISSPPNRISQYCSDISHSPGSQNVTQHKVGNLSVSVSPIPLEAGVSPQIPTTTIPLSMPIHLHDRHRPYVKRISHSTPAMTARTESINDNTRCAASVPHTSPFQAENSGNGSNLMFSHGGSKEMPFRCPEVPILPQYTSVEVGGMVDEFKHHPGNVASCVFCGKVLKQENLRAHIYKYHLTCKPDDGF